MVIKHISSVVALGGAVGGSVLIAANIGLAVVGYTLFLASSVASVHLLVTTKNSPIALILQNLFFVVVNVFGLIRHSGVIT
jgi:uncharacterized protein (UPF0261 family)